MRSKIIVAGLLVVIVVAAAFGAVKWLWPSVMDQRPTLVEMPPLAPVTRSSRIVLPAVISLSAIRELMERAPRDASGKLDIPSIPFPGGGSGPEINWSFAREPFAVAGGPDGLFLSIVTERGASCHRGVCSARGLRRPPGGFPP